MGVPIEATRIDSLYADAALPRDLIEQQGAGHCYVQRLHLSTHGDGHQRVAVAPGERTQTLAFGADHPHNWVIGAIGGSGEGRAATAP